MRAVHHEIVLAAQYVKACIGVNGDMLSGNAFIYGARLLMSHRVIYYLQYLSWYLLTEGAVTWRQ